MKTNQNGNSSNCATLTDNQDENWPDIYRNKLNHHPHDMHRSNHDCVLGQGVDSMDAVAFYWPAATRHDCLAGELTLGSTEKWGSQPLL